MRATYRFHKNGTIMFGWHNENLVYIRSFEDGGVISVFSKKGWPIAAFKIKNWK